MKTVYDVARILKRCDFDGWAFYVSAQDNGLPNYLQVRFEARDNDNPGSGYVWQHGRKWYISPHMTDSEIVQTAFKSVISAVEHEVREKFTYRGRAIFGPHFDVNKLVELCDERHALDVREPA